MKKLNLYILFSLIISVAVSCSSPKEEKKPDNKADNTVGLSADQLKNINIDTAKLVNDVSELALTGKISFDEDKVAKVYPLAGGNVLKVNVGLGDHVSRGKVLAVLRSSEINDMQNQYDIASSNLLIAKKNLDIVEELYKTNVNSEKDLFNARNEYKKALTDVNKIKQQLAIYGATAEHNDALYNILAPIDGYIVEKNLNENMEVRSDNAQSLFTVSYLNTVWVLADVFEADLSKVHEGESVDITTLAYPDKIFKGTIKQVGSLLDPATKTLKIRVVLDNSEGLLKPEMFAVVKVYNKLPGKVVEIPTKALVFDNSRFFVVIPTGNNRFKKQPVMVNRTVGDKTFIKEGLQGGEVIVTNGSLLTYSN